MEIIEEKTSSKAICHTSTFRLGKSLFHWHKNFEICQVIDKPCSFLIDGTLIKANVGDIVVINEYDIHQFLIEETTKIRIVQFDLSIFINLEVPLQPLKTHIKYEEIRKIPNLEKQLNAFFEIMESENRIVTDAKENPFLQNVAISLYYILMRHFSMEKTDRKKKKERDEFYTIIEYIKQHYTENLTIENIAQKFYISKTKLSLNFKKYAGINIHEYINTLRIKKANFMIAQGTNITETSFECGFQSIRTFNCAYKRHLGYTPTEYLKKFK